MNNSKKSVTAQAKKSKASRSKRAKKPKETIEFVAIPKQDLIWAKKQKPSVMTLWLECWECDPYGSRWMTLNHSLSKAAFFRAKKILSDKGLFIFKSERSIINGRETAYWSVQNLHGARRKNFGFELDNTVDNTVDNTNNTLNTTDVKSDSLQRDSDSPQRDSDSPQRDSESLYRDSIVPETTQNQGFQSPSITPHKHLNNSSKELLKVLSGETQDLDDRGIALEEQPASVPSCEESVDEQEKAPETEEKISDSWMSPEKNALSPTEKAILAEQTTEEYQRTSKEKAAELRAFVNGLKKKNKLERDARLKGESVIPTQEKSELEKKKSSD